VCSWKEAFSALPIYTILSTAFSITPLWHTGGRILIAIRIPKNLAIRAPGTGLKAEEEYIVFHYIDPRHIIGKIDARDIYTLIVGQSDATNNMLVPGFKGNPAHWFPDLFR
jgi:hypothetical protein